MKDIESLCFTCVYGICRYIKDYEVIEFDVAESESDELEDYFNDDELDEIKKFEEENDPMLNCSISTVCFFPFKINSSEFKEIIAVKSNFPKLTAPVKKCNQYKKFEV